MVVVEEVVIPLTPEKVSLKELLDQKQTRSIAVDVKLAPEERNRLREPDAQTAYHVQYLVFLKTMVGVETPLFDKLQICGSSICPLGITKGLEHRNTFTTYLGQAVIGTDQPIVYVSFGSGAKAQDFVILMHLLTHGVQVSQFVAIDEDYDPEDKTRFHQFVAGIYALVGVEVPTRYYSSVDHFIGAVEAEVQSPASVLSRCDVWFTDSDVPDWNKLVESGIVDGSIIAVLSESQNKTVYLNVCQRLQPFVTKDRTIDELQTEGSIQVLASFKTEPLEDDLYV